jgi:hypothetical protein
MMSAGDNSWFVHQSSLAVLPAEISRASRRNGRKSENFAYHYVKCFKWSLTCSKILRHGTSGFTSHPKEGVLWIFIALKNPSSLPGLNPRPLGPVASTLITTPPKRPFMSLQMLGRTCRLCAEDEDDRFLGNVGTFYKSIRCHSLEEHSLENSVWCNGVTGFNCLRKGSVPWSYEYEYEYSGSITFRNFLTRWATVSFSRKTVLSEVRLNFRIACKISRSSWDFRFWRRRVWSLVFWDVAPCSRVDFVALMMEAVRTSETSLKINLTTRRYILPEDTKLQAEARENNI